MGIYIYIYIIHYIYIYAFSRWFYPKRLTQVIHVLSVCVSNSYMITSVYPTVFDRNCHQMSTRAEVEEGKAWSQLEGCSVLP